jgi:hypothetical protein
LKKNGSHEIDDYRVPWDKIKEYKHNKKNDKGKPTEPTKGNPPKSSHYVVSHCNIEVTKDLFNTAYSPWKYMLLDIGTTPHMTFRRDFFEDFDDNVDGIVYFADKSNLKTSEMGTIRLKLPELPNFLLHNVLYLPELKI